MRAQGHQAFNFLVMSAGLLARKDKPGVRPLPNPAIAAPLSAVFATLPDILEPAVTPDHRQGFHSIALAVILGFAVYEAYRWEPDTPAQEALRDLVIIGGAAYLLHLVGDMLTAKGLPLVGR